MALNPRRSPFSPLVLVLSAAFPLTACGGEASTAGAAAPGKPVVWAAAWPIWSWANRIGGDLIDLRCVLPAGADVESFEPERKTIAAIADAELVLLHGAELEHWAMHASLPLGIVVDACRPLTAELIKLPEGAAHSHGAGEHHVHDGHNPHVWLDPVLAQKQARAVHEGLLRILPEQRAALDGRLATLLADLEALDRECQALRFATDDVVVTTHPTWAYLGKRYGWPLAEAHFHAEKELDDAGLTELAVAAGDKRVRAVLFEVPVPEAAQKRIRELLGAPCIVIDPDVTRSGEQLTRDTGAVLRAGVAALAAAMN